MNRSSFNRTRFNRPGLSGLSGQGYATVKLGGTATAAMIIGTPLSVAELKLSGYANAERVILADGLAAVALKGQANATVILRSEGGVAICKMSAEAASTLSGEASIHLTSLTLKPNETLVIDTNDMTITINGENGMRYLTADSEFFNLKQGVNTLVYHDTSGSRNISLNAIWKDRWL